MSGLRTAWRYTKGVLSGLVVVFGMVATILLIEIYEGVPDNLSVAVVIVGIVVAAYAVWKGSRTPRKREAQGVEQ